MFVKQIDSSIAEDEVDLQMIAARYGFAPTIHHIEKGPLNWIVMMDDLGDENTLSNIYGEDASKIPDWIWDDIRRIIAVLIDEGVEYQDITSYNFIEKDGKIYVIDFGDARYISRKREMNWFVKEFMKGHNGWNPDFR
jgi:tRNA A-37 threonylcarbamoyl transferase component Bud32